MDIFINDDSVIDRIIADATRELEQSNQISELLFQTFV
ncbi:hypothetical protein O166_03985 [Pseudogulbenkiania ferrooxidans EGD-HP2]|uniref:Transposase n=1 Tax=Pseudogulbenkiania ferrooxidans EGD-HP2 TaxID=1388764 RepID=A0ABN0N9R5_9NEIS|nr:hypothetical protein O166_03985 [Pseudogulbenkiania ferrooxidans EGD-HP2]